MKNNKILFWVIALIPIFQPKLFTQYNFTTYLYIVMNLIELLILLTINIYKKESRVSKMFFCWIIYRIYLFVVMCFNNNFSGILQWGYLSLMVSNMFLLFELARLTKSENKLIYSISVLGTFLLIANFATLLIFDRGIIRSTYYDGADNDYYLLGIKTQFTTMIFPTVTSAILNYYIDKSKKAKRNMIIAIFISILTIFYKNISTPLIGFILVAILTFLQTKLKIKVNFKFCMIIVLICQILIVFFNISFYFSAFFVNVLHKDATLSARMYIWENAKEVLANEGTAKLIFGNGINKGEEFVPYEGTYWQPHSQLLAWLHSGGIIGTFLIINLLCKLIVKKTNMNSYYIIGIFSLVEFFLSVTEVYFDVAVCYVPFLIIYYYFNNIKEVENE